MPGYHYKHRLNKAKRFAQRTAFGLLSLHSLLFPAFIASRPNWLMEKNNNVLLAFPAEASKKGLVYTLGNSL